QFQGFTAPTPLVVDHTSRNRSGQETGNSKQAAQLSQTVTTALYSLARQHQLTLNTLVQGAWALLLSRYSGEEDVGFGATRACRYWAGETEAESMIGLFINTLPLRVRVPPEMELVPWLQALRAQQVVFREYEHTPLAKIQEWSEIPPGTALFASILVYEN